MWLHFVYEDDRWEGLKGRRGYFRAERAGKMGRVGGSLGPEQVEKAGPGG